MDTHYRLFSKGDLDGFFGLFVDNLVQLLLIVALCSGVCGMRGEYAYLIYTRILPGAGISILLGNLFYAWQARRLARAEGRDDVTALPYGINTPSLLVYIFFVMLPVYRTSGDPRLAWQMGLLACIGSGVIEFSCAFVAQTIRRHTPRAALLASLAGIAIGFISLSFALQVWQFPVVAMVPFAMILLTYFARIRFPFGLPGGFLAVVSGSLLAWLLPSGITGIELSLQAVAAAWTERLVALPVWAGGELWRAAGSSVASGAWLGFLSVVIPMGLFNVIGSLQNIESAEAAGDRYAPVASLAVNGIGTIAAALFGSCFPTTIYIGHPGWKALGARAGYSTLNGVVITIICCSGTVAFISSLVPLAACVPIVIWIGIIITAQAFQAVPARHAPAVALGLFPAIAGLGAAIASGSFVVAAGFDSRVTVQAVLAAQGTGATVSGFLLHGLNLLNQGYIFTSMIIAALCVCLIEREFLRAALWSGAAGLLTLAGIVHAYQVKDNAVNFLLLGMQPEAGAIAFRAHDIAIGYFLVTVVLALGARLASNKSR